MATPRLFFLLTSPWNMPKPHNSDYKYFFQVNAYHLHKSGWPEKTHRAGQVHFWSPPSSILSITVHGPFQGFVSFFLSQWPVLNAWDVWSSLPLLSFHPVPQMWGFPDKYSLTYFILTSSPHQGLSCLLHFQARTFQMGNFTINNFRLTYWHPSCHPSRKVLLFSGETVYQIIKYPVALPSLIQELMRDLESPGWSGLGPIFSSGNE